MKEVIFKKTGNRYLVMGYCKMKNPVTREWQEAIEYSPIEDLSIKYVRELTEFNERFEYVVVEEK